MTKTANASVFILECVIKAFGVTKK